MMLESRPDPDLLLEQLRGQETQVQAGRLRIYLGASAGVGKTYAMLSAAQRELKAGRDVLIGVVETHGRFDTAALLAGLPRLPLSAVTTNSRSILEFDLDAALVRRPSILVVDELAHSNAPGSRHVKRWQDIEELIASGIEVWTAVNVQHLESLNVVVNAITGIQVFETIPDNVLDQADEIVLIDATANELASRLKAGKIYAAPQAELASQNFFRKGNLIALRELALRRVAERVQADAHSWRVEQSGGQGEGEAQVEGKPSASETLLACVGTLAGGENVVRATAQMSRQMRVPWHAVYVETSGLRSLPREERDQILANLKFAEEQGATISVLAGENIPKELANYARRNQCTTLVLGRNRSISRGWRLPWLNRSMPSRLDLLAPHLKLLEVPNANALQGRRRFLRHSEIVGESEPDGRVPWLNYALTGVAAVVITAISTPLVERVDLANIVMLFLLGVVLVAIKFGRGPAIFATFLNVAAFDFFFVPPRFSFAVSDVQYVITFAVMLAVGLITAQMTSGLRFAARIAASRERQAQSMFELSRSLSAALQSDEVVQLGKEALSKTFGGQVVILLTTPSGALEKFVESSAGPDGFDPGIADWVIRNGQSAGFATTTLSGNTWHYLPLKAPMRHRGVLALKPAHPRWLSIPEQVRQLDTLGRQIAIALERVHYADVAQQALVRMETEQLRNVLLAAVSHDVRTPLTAMLGLAETLRDSRPTLMNEQADLSHSIVGQARSLTVLVDKLLEMARLQSGTIKLKIDWQSVEEVVGSAIREVMTTAPSFRVLTLLPPDLPLVEFDALMIERVLVNLLENAIKFGQPPYQIEAMTTDDSLLIEVRDHGQGLPSNLLGREDILFEKFTRGQAESKIAGIGLGLAISKAIIEAHAGKISASNAPDEKGCGGAVFTICLPRSTPPQLPIEQEQSYQ